MTMTRALAAVLVPSVALMACSSAPGVSDEVSRAAPERLIAAATTEVPITAAIPEGYVAVPGMYTHRSCVHEVPNGGSADDENIFDKDGHLFKTFGRCGYTPILHPRFASSHDAGTAPDASALQSPDTDGWLSWTNQTIPNTATTWNFVNALMTVPSAAPVDPSVSADFYFNGIETNQPTILQPVLQWGSGTTAPGGEYYSGSSYRVYSDGTANYSTPIDVSYGDSIQMQVWLNSVSGSTYQWAVGFYDSNSGQHSSAYYNQTSGDGALFPNAYPAVHESYGDNNCEYGVTFTKIGIYANVNTAVLNEIGVTYSPESYWNTGTSPSCFHNPSTSGTTTTVN